MVIKHSLPTIDNSDVKSVALVVRSGNLAQGKKVEKFEKGLAEFIGNKGAVAVSSGSAALHLALLGLGVGKKDEIIMPTYVCLALLNAVNYLGARPVLCDVDEEDFNISVKEVKKKISRRTKVIIVPHMFGSPAEIDKLIKFKIPVIEDCANSVGATFKNKKVGSWGRLSAFSFYATKMLTSIEGGMVSSNSLSLLEKIKDKRDYDKKNELELYFNYKMSDVQAALGTNQLKKLPGFIKKRKKIASIYDEIFSDCKVKLPARFAHKDHVFYRYIIVMDRDVKNLIKRLKKQGIICERPVFKPLHQYLNSKGFQTADKLWKTSLSLPIYPSLDIRTAKRTALIIRKVLV